LAKADLSTFTDNGEPKWVDSPNVPLQNNLAVEESKFKVACEEQHGLRLGARPNQMMGYPDPPSMLLPSHLPKILSSWLSLADMFAIPSQTPTMSRYSVTRNRSA
jgi:hypothetical protein